MTQPYIGEIQLFGFNFNPRGWAFANGATIPISQNTALFSLLGVTYGGNGQTTFQLPNFAGRAGMCQGNGAGLSPRSLGQTAGTNTVTLTINQIPQHRHVLRATATSGSVASPANAIPAQSEEQKLYDTGTGVVMKPLASTGNGQPHENRQPSLGVNFCIALQGIYPSFP
jgi:microcystin-dependent protein